MLDPMKTSHPPKWSIPFVMTLRSRDVSGADIGAALREVESHCAESGEDPETAFGPPVDYAESLRAASPPDAMPRSAHPLAPTAIGLVGLLLTAPTVSAWRDGGDVQVSTGLAVSCIAALGVVAVMFQPAVYRRRNAMSTLAVVGFVAAFVAPFALKATALTAPLVVTAALALAGLLGSVVWNRGRINPDELVDPLTPERNSHQVMAVVTAWLFPIAALGIAIMTWLLPAK